MSGDWRIELLFTGYDSEGYPADTSHSKQVLVHTTQILVNLQHPHKCRR